MNFHPFDYDYVRRLTEGDPVTENEFAAYFGELLFLKLRSRLRSRQLIEDVAQETLLRVMQVLRQKGGVEQPERFGAFVNSVCNNVLLELSRKERDHDSLDAVAELRDHTVDLDAPLISRQCKKDVEAVFGELSPRDREVLRAVFLEEEERSEVCKRFKVEPDNLRLLLHRARLRFKKVYTKKVMAFERSAAAPS